MFFLQALNVNLSSIGQEFRSGTLSKKISCHSDKDINIGEIHYHIENKTNGGKQIEFSAESNQFEKKNQNWVRHHNF